MTIATNTEVTYSNVGIREDLTDIIYRVAREETPFMSNVGRTKAKQVKHEWQKESLASPSTANAQLEGDEYSTYDAANTPTRLFNVCQISRKTASISGTAEAVDWAGRASEMDRQIMLKGLELKRDMESILVGNQASVDGDSTTARKLRSLEAWYATNTSRGTGGANGSTTAAATDATTTNLRAITPGYIKTVHQACWSSGGKPTIIMCTMTKKGEISAMSLNDTTTGIGITKYQDTSDAMAVYGLDVIVTDAGKLRIVPSIHPRNRTVHLLEPGMAAVAFLRPIKTGELARTGDAMKKDIVTEYTLEMKNEAAHGVIADLT